MTMISLVIAFSFVAFLVLIIILELKDFNDLSAFCNEFVGDQWSDDDD